MQKGIKDHILCVKSITNFILSSVLQVVSVSLIVLQCVSAVKYLGPAPLAAYTSYSTLSPSFLPYRTVLDVLQPGLSFSYPWAPLAPRYHPLSGPQLIPFQPQLVSAPQNALVVSEVAAPVPAQVVDDDDVVDVAVETDDGSTALSEITVRDHINTLPDIPSSPFRDQNPIIPAGIVQATQPKFVQTIFKVDNENYHRSFYDDSFAEHEAVSNSGSAICHQQQGVARPAGVQSKRSGARIVTLAL